MKSSPMKTGMMMATLGGLVLATGVVAFRAQADQWDKKTIMTVDQPIQVEDTYLEPGTYVLKLLNSSSNRNIVQIFDKDQRHLVNTILAINNYRLNPTDKSQFTFYETPAGSAKALRGWFYPGDNYGQEFRYPKNLRTVAVAVVARPPDIAVVAPPAPQSVTAPEVVEAPAAQAEITVREEAKVEEAPRQEEPVVIAQNNPPAEPARVEAAPAPQAVETPTELPKTGTPYPLIGLGGLISLAGYGLLRLKGLA